MSDQGLKYSSKVIAMQNMDMHTRIRAKCSWHRWISIMCRLASNQCLMFLSEIFGTFSMISYDLVVDDCQTDCIIFDHFFIFEFRNKNLVKWTKKYYSSLCHCSIICSKSYDWVDFSWPLALMLRALMLYVLLNA